MYRNYRRRNCNQPEFAEDSLEDSCQNVDNGYSCNSNSCECDCGFDEPESMFPTNPELGQSYVPFQIMNRTFIPEVGLRMGTLFPELVSCYAPGQSMEENAYLRATNEIKGGCNDA